jgi:chorismate mutase/prephenate dehydratase
MRKISVAFQGERGAYSEEAINSFFKSNIIVQPCKNLYETFESAEKKNSDYAVVPVENSLEGSINETYDLLLKSPLRVSREITLRIHHALISKPDVEKERLRKVYSHPQALAQCRIYLRKLGVTPVASYDTAGSVKMIKKEKSRSIAAIASERASFIYDMKILDKNIEDNPNNYTRFFILSYEDTHPTGNDKTSIVFSAKHEPGALYSALKVFADRKINLTRIESRPTREMPWEYNFYLDFDGHMEEGLCKDALRVLDKKNMIVKVLGSYPKVDSEMI